MPSVDTSLNLLYILAKAYKPRHMRTHLVGNCYTTLNVKEAINVSAVDSIGDVELFHPFGIDLAQTLFIFRIPLNRG